MRITLLEFPRLLSRFLEELTPAPCPNPPYRCVKSSFDLLKQNKIEIFYTDNQDFFALVYQLDAQGDNIQTSLPLPLVGIPKQIHRFNLEKIICFLEHTHLVPEKGVNGDYNRVTVHVSGLGGVKPKIPFQPGLILGSVVEAATLEKMEKYAAESAKMEYLVEQLNNAQQQIVELNIKIKAEEKLGEKKNTVLISCWNNEVKRRVATIKTLELRLKIQNSEELPIFEGFHQGLVSPIDVTLSKLEVQPRGFPSVHFATHYISMKEDITEIHDKVKRLSNANNASIEGGYGLFKGNLSHDWSKATANRISTIKSEGQAEGVLLINAIFTTTFVKCFTHLKFDKDRLKMIYSAMKSANPIEMKKYGITESDGKKKVYLLTEAVQGGEFTAIMTFLDTQKMNRKSSKQMQEDGSDTTLGVEASYLAFSASGGVSFSSQLGSQKEDDVLRSLSSTKVNLEFHARGAIPKCVREVVEHEAFKFSQLNPSSVDLTAQDKTCAKTMSDGTPKEKKQALRELHMKRENSHLAALNARELTSSKDKQSIHTISGLMDTYDNFVSQMGKDPDCGFPIGFNYDVFDEERIKAILDELDPPSLKHEPPLVEEQPPLKKARAPTEAEDKKT